MGMLRTTHPYSGGDGRRRKDGGKVIRAGYRTRERMYLLQLAAINPLEALVECRRATRQSALLIGLIQVSAATTPKECSDHAGMAESEWSRHAGYAPRYRQWGCTLLAPNGEKRMAWRHASMPDDGTTAVLTEQWHSRRTMTAREVQICNPASLSRKQTNSGSKPWMEAPSGP